MNEDIKKNIYDKLYSEKLTESSEDEWKNNFDSNEEVRKNVYSYLKENNLTSSDYNTWVSNINGPSQYAPKESTTTQITKEKLLPSEDFSFTKDVSNAFKNTVETVKLAPERANLFVSNIQDKIYRATGLDKSRLSSLNSINAYNSMVKIDESAKRILPTQDISEGFASGDPKKIASSIIGAGIQAGSSILQGIATGGSLPMIDMFTSAYTESLRDSSKGDISKQFSMFLSDEDKEAIPFAEGVISAALEKVGLDKTTSSLLRKVPSGIWKKAIDIASTSGVEGVTEFLQDVTGQVSRDITSGRDIEVDWSDSFESLLKGAFGTAGVVGSATTLKALSTGNKSLDAEVNNSISEAQLLVSDLKKEKDITSEQIISSKEAESTQLTDPSTTDETGGQETGSPIDYGIDESNLSILPTENIQNKNEATIYSNKNFNNVITKEIPANDISNLSSPESLDDIFNKMSDDINSSIDSSNESIDNFLNKSKEEYNNEIESYSTLYPSDIESEDSSAPISIPESFDLDLDYLTKDDVNKSKNKSTATEKPLTGGKDIKKPYNELGRFHQKQSDLIDRIYESSLLSKLETKKLDNLKKTTSSSLTDKKTVKEISKINSDLFSRKLKGRKLNSKINLLISKAKQSSMIVADIANLDDLSMKIINDATVGRISEIESNADKVLDNQKNIIEDYVNKNRINSTDSYFLGAHGKLTSLRKGETIEESENVLIKSAVSKVEAIKKNRFNKDALRDALYELEIVKEVVRRNRNGEAILNEKQQGLRDLMDSYIKNTEEDYKNTVETFLDKKFDVVENYFPTQAIGGFEGVDLDSYKEGLISALGGIERRESPVPNYASSSSKQRSKYKDGVYYNLDGVSSFLNYVRNSSFDIEATPEIFAISQALRDKKTIDQIGENGSKALLNSMKGFVNRRRGAKKAGYIAKIESIRSSSIATAMGTVGQFGKQFLPSITQAFIVSNGNPITYTRALVNAMTLPNEWYKQNAPGIYERGKSFDRLTLGSSETEIGSIKENRRKEFAKVSQSISNAPVHLGDLYAAKVIFMSSFLRNGGDINNVDKDIVAKATNEQSLLQGVNTASSSGYMFNSEKEIHQVISRTLFTYSNFALNQAFGTVTSLKNLNKPQARRMLLGNIASSLTFYSTSVAVSALTKELYKNIFDKDEEELIDDSILNEFTKDGFIPKMISNTALDLSIGAVPLIGNTFKEISNKIMKSYKGEDYEKERDELFFVYKDFGATSDIEVVLGPALGQIMSMANDFCSHVYDAVMSEEDVDGKYSYMASVALAQLLLYIPGISKNIPLPKGELQKYLREVRKNTKKEIKDATIKSNGRSNRGRVNRGRKVHSVNSNVNR